MMNVRFLSVVIVSLTTSLVSSLSLATTVAATRALDGNLSALTPAAIERQLDVLQVRALNTLLTDTVADGAAEGAANAGLLPAEAQPAVNSQRSQAPATAK